MEHWPEIEIKSWKHFNEALEFLHLDKYYLSHWAFRGQSNSDWTLKPTIVRILERPHINRDLAQKFELTIYREFLTKNHLHESLKLKSFVEGNIIYTFTIMQHYGAPTRLVDWTTSPYVALFFAINENFDSDGSVYMFNQSILNDVNKEETPTDETYFDPIPDSDNIKSIMANSYSQRSNSQQGIFTIASNIDKDHENLIFKSLKKLHKKNMTPFMKFTINKNLKLEFLSRLKILNITSGQLFPDLYGFSNSLKELLEIRTWEEKCKK